LSARFSWLAFGVLPALVLVTLLIATAVGTVVLDHDVLGRDAEGWPILYKTTWLRYAVDFVHLGALYVLPPAVAVAFLVLALRTNSPLIWPILGGIIVCTLGSTGVIEAGWTGIKGSSTLNIAIAAPQSIALRAASSVALLVVAVVYFRRR